MLLFLMLLFLRIWGSALAAGLFFYQGDCVAGPHEISGAVVAQKPEEGDTFNLFTIYNVGSGPICVS